ncbi:MAG: quinate 5-dehydrogenase [Chthonomonas sp.]|nr:quinate 5-dehydrogenase [Chthonomonas sp.]
MKRVVSISLGTSERDKSTQVEILGEQFSIERIGTDGDMKRFAAMFTELDGQVAALGVGGCDIYVVVGDRKYAFREIVGAVRGAKTTPVVDGSGLKHTLERETIQRLQREGTVNFAEQRVLLMSAADRYGMAQSLSELCPEVLYGDLMFGVGLPLRVRSYKGVQRLGAILLPIITQLPFQWFYPTGDKQKVRTPKFQADFGWATVIAGDSLFINRYAPDRLDGKTIITQSVRKANVEWMRSAGVSQLITTTPVFGGETFATNVMEGVLVSLIGKPVGEITPADYLAKMAELDWKPNVLRLQEP